MDIGFHLLKENRKKFEDYSKFINRKITGYLHSSIMTNGGKTGKYFISFQRGKKIFKRRFTRFFNFYNNTSVTETPHSIWLAVFLLKKVKDL